MNDDLPRAELERLEQLRLAMLLLSTHELRASSAAVVEALLFELEAYGDDDLVAELAGEAALAGLPMRAGELRGRLRATLEQIAAVDEHLADEPEGRP